LDVGIGRVRCAAVNKVAVVQQQVYVRYYREQEPSRGISEPKHKSGGIELSAYRMSCPGSHRGSGLVRQGILVGTFNGYGQPKIQSSAETSHAQSHSRMSFRCHLFVAGSRPEDE
jgi:hypothetical protein